MQINRSKPPQWHGRYFRAYISVVIGCVCVHTIIVNNIYIYIYIYIFPGGLDESRWGYYPYLMGTGTGIYVFESSWGKWERDRLAEIWKYVSRIKDFIRFTMKCPVNIRQQTVHTAYMEQVNNNKNINRMFVTKPHNVATSSISSFMNLIKSD